jgi:predicted porin
LRGVAGPTDLDVFHIGLQYTLGAGKFHLAFNSAKDSARSPWATADAKVDSFGVAYFHNLSKRSALYAGAALANNKDQSRVALGAACCVGGWTTARGEDSRVVQLGMRHSF